MTHEDKGHYARKHPRDRAVGPEIVEAIRSRISDNEIPCAVAFAVAKDLGVSPAEVGVAADLLEVRIVKCQLGLYGYKPRKCIVTPAEEVSPELEAAVRAALVKDRLPCEVAWEIAERLGLQKMAVSSACEAMKIKISPCQLGSF